MKNENEVSFAIISKPVNSPWYVFHGTAKTINAAKMLATKNEELWSDNEYHKPDIYKIEDCEEIVNSDEHFFQPNKKVYIPKIDYCDVPCSPYIVWCGNRWVELVNDEKI